MNRKERRGAEKRSRSKQSGAVDQSVAQAITVIQQGDLAQGEQLLTEIRRKNPGNVEAKHQLGMVLARTGRSDEGIGLLREAATQTPGEALYWNNLAAACLAVQRDAEAVEAGLRATELDPNYVMAWENLGFAYRDLRKPADAVAAFGKAARVQALEHSTLRAWASSLLELGQFAAAETKAQDAVRLHPDDAEALNVLGVALMQQGKDEGARDAFKRSLDIDPDRPAAAVSYGRLLLKQPDGTDAGLRWLRRATSTAPRSPAVWRVLAEAAFRAGQKEEAAMAIDRAARLAPGDAAIADLAAKIRSGDATAQILEAPKAVAPAAPPKPATEGANPVFDLSILKINQ